MAGTAMGYWPKEKCSDCGEKGVFFKHLGPLVPEGKVGRFCTFCWSERGKDYENGKEPKPLGTKPVVKASFVSKKIRVETKSGAIYRFGEPNEKGIRTVHRNQTLPFNLCKILCLTEGKPIYLISIKGKRRIGWWITAEVLSIKKD